MYKRQELSSLKVKNNQDKYNINIEIDIKNTGNYDIEEVVQCYIKDLESKYAVKNYLSLIHIY